jgi:NAD(P)-dependent dehydrogenase (short-subunit alcohol dehydrogenase family)
MSRHLINNFHPPAIDFEARRLEGRVVLVTGASSGIGRAAAKRFAAEGACVAAGARRTDLLNDLVAEINAAGGESMAVTLDVTDEQSVQAAVAATVERFGRLDGAFNNAGQIGSGKPLHQTDPDYWRRVVEVNLTGVYYAMKHEIPVMLAGDGGSIVNTSSTGGIIAMPGFTDYAASKWALHGLTKSAALEYARHGIRINIVAPGSTRTEMWNTLGERHVAEIEAQLGGWVPMNAVALADDVARVALFLLSEESRWMTGAVLPTDGGQHVASRTSASRFEHWAEREPYEGGEAELEPAPRSSTFADRQVRGSR